MEAPKNALNSINRDYLTLYKWKTRQRRWTDGIFHYHTNLPRRKSRVFDYERIMEDKAKVNSDGLTLSIMPCKCGSE